MPEYSEDRRLDDQLANFTDQLLSHESGDKPQPSIQDETLEKLQKTVIQLKRAGEEVPKPDSEFAARLRIVLLEEWQKMESRRKTEPVKRVHFLQSLSEQFKNLFSVRPTQTLFLRFGMVVVGVLVLLLFIFPVDTPEVTGSAGLGSLGWPVIVLIGILCIGIIWFLRRKDKG
jgi:hypothetical protein